MAGAAHPSTLFHLVPANQPAQDALLHPDNRRYVSSSTEGPGLEVGYHVPSPSRGHVIARLGREADLILPETTPRDPMSRVHVAFEINPETHLVLLSVRSKRVSSVTSTILDGGMDDASAADDDNSAQGVTGGGVVLYAHNYRISIASYGFILVWRSISEDANGVALRALALQGYQASLRNRPADAVGSEAHSWHVARSGTAEAPSLQDVARLRQNLGSGVHGTVYKAVDRSSGNWFAIKVVYLEAQGHVDAARALLQRELKVMQGLKHNHIVECLGHQLLHTTRPEISMPLRDGSLASLAKTHPANPAYEALCFKALAHVLSALDYLASQGLVHRGVKPDNILYYRIDDEYHFQLADFGLASDRDLAFGVDIYQAPELYPHVSGVSAALTSKLDLWSLYASMVATYLRPHDFPPPGGISDYRTVLDTLLAKVPMLPALEPMARTDPDRRASAAQMLVKLFDGHA